MSAFGISIANTEFDAAQALLDLQSNIRDTNTLPNSSNTHDRIESMETAKLFLSCFISSKVPNQPIKAVTSTKVGTVTPAYTVGQNTTVKSDVAAKRSPKRKTPDQELTHDRHNQTYHGEESSKRSKLFKRKPIKHFTVTSGPVARKVSYAAEKQTIPDVSETKVKCRDMGTQTEEEYQLPIIEKLELTISKLCEKIKRLQEQIKLNSRLAETVKQDVSDNDKDFEDDDDDDSYKVDSRELAMDDSDASDSNETFTERDTPDKIKPKSTAGKYNCFKNTAKVLSNRNINSNADDMVPIGDGNALIPSRIFRHVNWGSYTGATRKLLTSVFSRRVLATHSLTGKPSPAFPNKPAKKKLDPALVNDIVQTVAERCCVPENVVRTSITTKCADESKMFRTRENNKKKRKHKDGSENIPPESDSD